MIPGEPPPPPLAAVPPVPPVPPAAAPPAADPRVSSAKALAGWAIGCTALAALCCGGGMLALLRVSERMAGEVAAQAEAVEADESRRDEARVLLDTLADRLVLDSQGALPLALSEAPPKDPWGRAVQYLRRSRTEARLRSAGPDGRWDTADDVERAVKLE